MKVGVLLGSKAAPTEAHEAAETPEFEAKEEAGASGDLSMFSDDELIAELKSRGFEVEDEEEAAEEHEELGKEAPGEDYEE